MGRETVKKIEKAKLAEDKILSQFSARKHSIKEADKKNSDFGIKSIVKIYQLNYLESYFIRSESDFNNNVKSKDPEKLKKQVMSHLFEKYPVSHCFKTLSLKNVGEASFKYSKNKNNTYMWGMPFNWYLCAVQGDSLFKKQTKGLLTKNETHTLLTQKYTENLEEALVFSVAINAGANYGLAGKLSKTKISNKLYSQIFKSMVYTSEGLRETAKKDTVILITELLNIIRLFSRIVTTETVSEIDDVLDYLFNRRNEEPNFTIVGKGYTFKALKKITLDWHYFLRRQKLATEQISQSWKGFSIKPVEYEKEDEFGDTAYFRFEEILTGRELHKEGNSQHHCVFSYMNACKMGFSSIVRLYDPLRDKSLVTIEVRKSSYNNIAIVQARRFANKEPKAMEKQLITQWARANGIGISIRGF